MAASCTAAGPHDCIVLLRGLLGAIVLEVQRLPSNHICTPILHLFRYLIIAHAPPPSFDSDDCRGGSHTAEAGWPRSVGVPSARSSRYRRFELRHPGLSERAEAVSPAGCYRTQEWLSEKERGVVPEGLSGPAAMGLHAVFVRREEINVPHSGASASRPEKMPRRFHLMRRLVQEAEAEVVTARCECSLGNAGSHALYELRSEKRAISIHLACAKAAPVCGRPDREGWTYRVTRS